MSQQSNAYAEYLKSCGPQDVYIRRHNLRAGAIKQDAIKDLGLVNKIEASGRPDGVYIMSDGRVYEICIDYSVEQIFEFPSEKSWREFRPAMGWNRYFEFGVR